MTTENLEDAKVFDAIQKGLDAIEAKMQKFDEKAQAESKLAGEVSAETKSALDKLGESQREMAERLVEIEQKGSMAQHGGEEATESWGQELVNSEVYKSFVAGNSQRAQVTVKNTSVGSDANVAPDRRPGVVGGAFQPLTLEAFITQLPTTSNAIEFTREATFVNNAAETAEGGAKPESDLTWELVSTPVATVPHYTRISRQLANDNAALAAYVDRRMRYGVDRRVEGQLIAGDGVAPNLDGIIGGTNFTAHGYAAADLGATLSKLVLIRKIIGDLENAGYPADAIVLNPLDWAQVEVDLFTSTANAARVNTGVAGRPELFGRPVISSVGMTADNLLVGSFGQGATIYNREGTTIAMSESDADNFTKNLITIRAERRLALTVEVPAAIRGGDLTPA